MQLKTDKCNFIHLGRCVKSGALNIPHDSPWLIFPWSETPIISHEPNSTRMARRSPRGQFSGHLPLTHHSCEGERRGRSCQEGPEACTYGGGEGRWGRGGEVEGSGGEEWARVARWRGLTDWRWRPLVGHTWRRGGHGEILKRGNKEDKENIQVTREHLPTMHPAGMKGSRRSQVHTRHNNRRFDFPSFIVSLSFFTLIRKEMPNPLKQRRSVDHKGHQLWH